MVLFMDIKIRMFLGLLYFSCFLYGIYDGYQHIERIPEARENITMKIVYVYSEVPMKLKVLANKSNEHPVGDPGRVGIMLDLWLMNVMAYECGMFMGVIILPFAYMMYTNGRIGGLVLNPLIQTKGLVASLTYIAPHAWLELGVLIVGAVSMLGVYYDYFREKLVKKKGVDNMVFAKRILLLVIIGPVLLLIAAFIEMYVSK